MKCVPASRGKQILLEVHAGIYGHHAPPRSLVEKTFRQGFYWPTALRDAEELQPSQSPGHSRSGASTWWDLSRKVQAVLLTYS